MAKSKTIYVCSECGYETPRWLGRCPDCGSWNTLTEQESAPAAELPEKKLKRAPGGGADPLRIDEIPDEAMLRRSTGIGELDRVLGGGIVEGSLVLVGGDPGIGKSTLLTQVSANYAAGGRRVLYVSGEESTRQIKMRARRLGASSSELYILSENDMTIVERQIERLRPELAIVDSIQTMYRPELASAPGSVSQVRESASVLMRLAKTSGCAIMLVGNVTKEGAIAGPRVLEHMVDAVLYFEGDRNMSYRILRAVKNRYGSTNEIGVFEMLDSGLSQVENPSLMLISGRPKNTSGTCIACAMEGTRPILAEVQALVSASSFGNPRRMATGFDYSRMAMLLAVLEKRAGYFFGNMDAYINVIGGLKLDEPATDLSVALALISSLKDVPIRDDVLAFGEIGLGGEIRSVNHCEQRIKEAARLGFKTCIIPRHNFKSVPDKLKKEIEVIGVKNVYEAFANCVD